MLHTARIPIALVAIVSTLSQLGCSETGGTPTSEQEVDSPSETIQEIDSSANEVDELETSVEPPDGTADASCSWTVDESCPAYCGTSNDADCCIALGGYPRWNGCAIK